MMLHYGLARYASVAASGEDVAAGSDAENCFRRDPHVSVEFNLRSLIVRSSCLAQGGSHFCLAEIVSVKARVERGASGCGVE